MLTNCNDSCHAFGVRSWYISAEWSGGHGQIWLRWWTSSGEPLSPVWLIRGVRGTPAMVGFRKSPALHVSVWVFSLTACFSGNHSGRATKGASGVKVFEWGNSGHWNNSRSTRSSSLVTLLHPQAQSSLKITNRSFRYAGIWNKLPPSLRVPCQSATSECSPPSPGSDSAPKSVDGTCVSQGLPFAS